MTFLLYFEFFFFFAIIDKSMSVPIVHAYIVHTKAIILMWACFQTNVTI